MNLSNLFSRVRSVTAVCSDCQHRAVQPKRGRSRLRRRLSGHIFLYVRERVAKVDQCMDRCADRAVAVRHLAERAGLRPAVLCRKLLIASAVPLLSVTMAIGQAVDGDVLLVGTGRAGTWQTRIDLSNPESNAVTVGIYYPAVPLGIPCMPNCPGFVTVTIPPRGTSSVGSASLFGLLEGPLILEVTRQGGPVPPVSVRWVNQADPEQKFELPPIRRASLLALNPGVLAFTGGLESPAGEHSNLVLAQFGADSVEVLIEAFSAEGAKLGEMTASVPPGHVRGGLPRALFLVHVLTSMGITNARDVQIRVTKTSGEGALWGFLATVDEAGAVQVSLGQNL